MRTFILSKTQKKLILPPNKLIPTHTNQLIIKKSEHHRRKNTSDFLNSRKTFQYSQKRESLISFPPIMKNTQHLSSSQTSDNITPNNPECSFEKPFY